MKKRPSKKGYSRPQRVADLLQTALAGILQNYAFDVPLGLVTITSVSISPDLSFAKVFISVLDDTKVKETVDLLNEHKKELRYLLAQEVKLRIAPELKFIYDDSVARGANFYSLINHVLKNNE
jgi:ribosome-binding factor A